MMVSLRLLTLVGVYLMIYLCQIQAEENNAKELQVTVIKSVENCFFKTKHGDTMHVHYTGTLEDGSVFHSSRPSDQPYIFTIGYGQVIKGYELGLLDMCEGEIRQLVIPPELAYGDGGDGHNIPGGATLTFEVELMKNENKDTQMSVEKTVEKCDIKSEDGDVLHVHYNGYLENGTKFDSSYPWNTPFMFTLGDRWAIVGYDLGLLGMCEGEIRKLIIPPNQAYGEQGRGDDIPGSATLIFEVELVKIDKKKELQVIPVKESDCNLKSEDGDIMHVHYTGTLEDGTEFESSRPSGVPILFTLGTGFVIQGYDLGLVGMCEGDKRKLVIPPHLAYKDDGHGDNIPGSIPLTFEVELVKLDKKKDLEVKIVKESKDCELKARDGDILHVHYIGTLEDGTEFESSRPSGQPFVFTLGTGYVIRGYDLGLVDMCEGDIRKLIIPPHLAYGDHGHNENIPGSVPLIFEVELMKLERKELQVIVEKTVEDCKLKAKNGDLLHFHYTGYLEDGKMFESSHTSGQPYIFTLGRGEVIQGYEIGLVGMCKGEKRKLVIPPHLAYGENGAGDVIPGGETLTFEVELMEIKRKELQVNVEKSVENCSFKSANGDTLHVHYTGYLEDGTQFETSYTSGQPYVFTLGRGEVIQGYDKGLIDMCEGEIRKLVIPPDLAYGEHGDDVIPGGATLTFEVELVKIDRKTEL